MRGASCRRKSVADFRSKAETDATDLVNDVFHPAECRSVDRQTDTGNSDGHQRCPDAIAGILGRCAATASGGIRSTDYSPECNAAVAAMYEASGSGFVNARAADRGRLQRHFEIAGLGR